MQTLLLVVAALTMAALFVALITNPLRQIERAINLLGRGTYQDNIRIDGPLDLQVLCRRLDWLRSRLQQLEQQRSAFLRHVSHELKTPLAARLAERNRSEFYNLLRRHGLDPAGFRKSGRDGQE